MSDIAKLQEHIKMLKAQVELGQRIEKLLANPDFQKVIIEDFCKEEVARNMNMAGNPNEDPHIRETCARAAYSGGDLKRFLVARQKMSETAASAIQQTEQEIQMIQQMDNDDND